MSESDNAEKGRSWLERVASSPTLVLAMAVVTVLSVIVAIVLPLEIWAASRSGRDLVYAVNPIYTRVVTAGQSSEISVQYHGSSLGDTNVTAAQVAIWNRGKESIQPEDILQTITIRTDPPSPILEASIRTESRDVIGLVLGNASSSFASGELPISWRILERNDGASIQLVYLGSDSVRISVGGVVTGIGEPKRLEVGVKPQSPYQEAYNTKKANTISGIFGLLGGVVLLLYVLNDMRSGRRINGFDYLMFPVCVIVIGVAIWFITRPGPMLPPFGF
jgi:hypothetical protein